MRLTSLMCSIALIAVPIINVTICIIMSNWDVDKESLEEEENDVRDIIGDSDDEQTSLLGQTQQPQQDEKEDDDGPDFKPKAQ